MGNFDLKRPRAVLLDRDGTLVVDVPYNGDPDRVVPAATAREAVDRLRRAQVAVAVVSNQSGIARGLVTAEQVAAVNARVEALLGPLGPFLVCPHGPDDGCGCRKPAPGLLVQAAAALGVAPAECAMVGDIGADVAAGLAAGARPVLVSTAATRPEEIDAAPEVAPTLLAAVERLLGPEQTGPALERGSATTGGAGRPRTARATRAGTPARPPGPGDAADRRAVPAGVNGAPR